MIPGIDDDPEPPPPAPPPKPPEAGRPMVSVSLGFYQYLQECADQIAAMSTDIRPMSRRLCLEWRLAARALQISYGKNSE